MKRDKIFHTLNALSVGFWATGVIFFVASLVARTFDPSVEDSLVSTAAFVLVSAALVLGTAATVYRRGVAREAKAGRLVAYRSEAVGPETGQ